jgi:hypothetical protein
MEAVLSEVGADHRLVQIIGLAGACNVDAARPNDGLRDVPPASDVCSRSGASMALRAQLATLIPRMSRRMSTRIFGRLVRSRGDGERSPAEPSLAAIWQPIDRARPTPSDRPCDDDHAVARFPAQYIELVVKDRISPAVRPASERITSMRGGPHRTDYRPIRRAASAVFVTDPHSPTRRYASHNSCR